MGASLRGRGQEASCSRRRPVTALSLLAAADCSSESADIVMAPSTASPPLLLIAGILAGLACTEAQSGTCSIFCPERSEGGIGSGSSCSTGTSAGARECCGTALSCDSFCSCDVGGMQGVSNDYNDYAASNAVVATAIGIYLLVILLIFLCAYLVPIVFTYCCVIKPAQARVRLATATAAAKTGGRRRQPLDH